MMYHLTHRDKLSTKLQSVSNMKCVCGMDSVSNKLSASQMRSWSITSKVEGWSRVSKSLKPNKFLVK